MSPCHTRYVRTNFDTEKELPKRLSHYKPCRKRAVSKAQVGLGRKKKSNKASKKPRKKNLGPKKKKRPAKKKALKVKRNGCRYCRKVR